MLLTLLCCSRLACRQEVLAALERHDAGGKGYLTREEFTSAAQDIFACVCRLERSAAGLP